MPSRPCSSCGLPVDRGRLCPEHARAYDSARYRRWHNPAYDGEWRAFSQRMLAQHRRDVGPWCPGDGLEHDAHPAHDLTLDHVVPLAEGGALLDPGNVRVLCRSWNSSRGRKGRVHRA